MAANRVIDRGIDARNPRTARRELVTGAVSVRTATVGAAVALAVFLAAAAALDPLCLVLAPLAVVPLVLYPYAKRVTDVPHAVLGLAQAVAPVGAWIAVTGGWDWRAGGARARRRHLDRRLRPDLRLPGRRDRPADRGPLGAGPVGRAGRAAGLDRHPRRHLRAAGLVGRARRLRPTVVRRAGAHRGRLRLRALDRPRGRPVPGQPRLLHRQRRRRPRPARLRGRRPRASPPACTRDRAAGPAAVGGRGVRRVRHAVRPGRAQRTAGRRAAGRPGGVPGRPADPAGRDRAGVAGRALAGRPGGLAGAGHRPARTSPTTRPATWPPARPAARTRPAAWWWCRRAPRRSPASRSACPRTCCSGPPT